MLFLLIGHFLFGFEQEVPYFFIYYLKPGMTIFLGEVDRNERGRLRREQPETRDPAGACDEEARAGPCGKRTSVKNTPGYGEEPIVYQFCNQQKA